MAEKRTKRGLGKGLGALIPGATQTQGESKISVPENGKLVELEVTKIEPNKDQPRKKFNEEALAELTESIKEHGILQPITVIPRGQRYVIVSGERRWRAARKASLKKIPVIIRTDLSDQDVTELSLIENIQREDLNPIEEALAYKRLLEEFHMKQEEVAERVSKSRTAVTNSMRLLKLTKSVQQMVIDGTLSTGHARALIPVEDAGQQKELAKQIVEKQLSVRDTEKLIRAMGKPKRTPKKGIDDKELASIYQEQAEKLKQVLGTKVEIAGKGNGAGKIEIEFYSNQDFDTIIHRLVREN